MIPPTLYARLDRKGEWVVCTGLDCHERFAEVLVVQRGQRSFRFGSGWVFDQRERVWHKSKRARKRLDQGREPSFRSWFKVLDHPGEPWKTTFEKKMRSRSPSDYGNTLKAEHAARTALVRCPRCHRLQTLDPKIVFASDQA